MLLLIICKFNLITLLLRTFGITSGNRVYKPLNDGSCLPLQSHLPHSLIHPGFSGSLFQPQGTSAAALPTAYALTLELCTSFPRYPLLSQSTFAISSPAVILHVLDVLHLVCYIPPRSYSKRPHIIYHLARGYQASAFEVYVLLVLALNMSASYTCSFSCQPRKFCKYNLNWEPSFSFAIMFCYCPLLKQG